MPTKVYTVLSINKEKIRDEDLLKLIDSKSDWIVSNGDIPGNLIIESEGNPTIEIDDDLSADIYNLCFDAVKDVLKDGKSAMPYFAFPGQINLELDEDMVLLYGDHVPDAIFPQEEFLTTLLNCGKRYIKLMENISPKGSFDHYLEYMNPAMTAAEEALTAKYT